MVFIRWWYAVSHQKSKVIYIKNIILTHTNHIKL